MDAKSQTMHLEHDVSDKGDEAEATSSNNVHEDSAGEHVHVSEADDKRLCRKTDIHLLPVLIYVYILQILDKQVRLPGRLIWPPSDGERAKQKKVLTYFAVFFPSSGYFILCRLRAQGKCSPRR